MKEPSVPLEELRRKYPMIEKLKPYVPLGTTSSLESTHMIERLKHENKTFQSSRSMTIFISNLANNDANLL